MLALCNLLTNSSYFADAVIFNLIYFIGPVLLFKMMNAKKIFKTIPLSMIVFLIPSFVFWQSGLHKDGVIFTSFMVIVYLCDRIIEAKTFVIKRHLPALLIAIALLFSFRNYMLILLAPAIFGWWLVHAYSKRGVWLTIGLYVIGGISLFFLRNLSDDLNPLKYIVNRHNEFIALGGGSQLTMPHLEATINSFVSFLPHALDIALLRPHFSEIENMSYWPAIAENALMIIVVISIFMPWGKGFFSSGNQKFPTGLFCFLFCFTLSFLMLAGYTITLTGAIVRYRSFVLPLATMLLLLASFRKNRVN